MLYSDKAVPIDTDTEVVILSLLLEMQPSFASGDQYLKNLVW